MELLYYLQMVFALNQMHPNNHLGLGRLYVY